ncbi:hypothetical protein [Pedobacter psychroterrae]|uniref:Uncharacterized protein n=1 Tax=Pedobacter psychroterrae TaxID=2530453 RepID=A0A4V2ML28_9SPHI|nr:hypothetical protein [Pedobacter psychroterrae]TCD00527.1 hypothetical protein EZ437_15010 [Pedobacter psychroterrae]
MPLKNLRFKTLNCSKLLLVLVWLFAGCNFKKYYVRDDYSFYSKEFQLDKASLLQTDGVYLSDKKEVATIYKFYPTGQVNMLVDPNHELKTDNDYMKAFNRRISDPSPSGRATLFEGYYRIKDDKVVIQFMNQPRRQFYYSYAYLTKGQLVIVKTTHIGRGKMDEKHYQTNYRAVYQFEPGSVNGYLPPNW